MTCMCVRFIMWNIYNISARQIDMNYTGDNWTKYLSPTCTNEKYTVFVFNYFFTHLYQKYP